MSSDHPSPPASTPRRTFLVTKGQTLGHPRRRACTRAPLHIRRRGGPAGSIAALLLGDVLSLAQLVGGRCRMEVFAFAGTAGRARQADVLVGWRG